MTIELSEYVIDAIANAVVKKMQEPKTDTWSIKDVADILEKHELIAEQEPCEDAISRTEVIKSIDEREDVNGKVDAESVRTDIVLMPSVTPQPKTGYWINLNENNDGYSYCDGGGNPYIICSECGIYNGTDQSDYCSNCGAKMEVEK